MRVLLPLLAGAMALSGCVSTDMMAKAQGRPGPLDPPNQPPMKPNPGYYALVPVVLPFDLITLPIQYIYLQNRRAPRPPMPPPQQQPPQQQYYYTR